ncbi:hypothetical protein HYH03_014753 [Edaphochlamys debaryana]|uniref:Fe2OG dioxygenase domain-containing protein n=1 Tax=Edaphochlamys debaryana TaxID=47281 RepID=A0A836BT84_9CHLO|nr:hypothetical protein HYH03_014753 [Edaphochlamys debaryana]|eukprot:KAG2486583.1 hypothetical protein HYH03_014753 [Edaphochlamys debaryana]
MRALDMRTHSALLPGRSAPAQPLLRRPAQRVLPQAFAEERSTGPGAAPKPVPAPVAPTRTLVTFDYADLVAGKDLSAAIEEAYGPNGLGALVVANIPQYPELRRRLLPLAAKLANLDPKVLASLEDPESHYSFGWSLGREALSDGRPDSFKGSFYANPLADDQLVSSADDFRPRPQSRPANGNGVSSSGRLTRSMVKVAALRAAHPGYYRRNLWPSSPDGLSELEPAFKALGRLVCSVGYELMEGCDRYVASRLGAQPGKLSGVFQRSMNPKARLLHYFPTPQLEGPAQTAPQDWCGWHYDHGSLTGLTSALYLDARGQEVPCPDPAAGLYIQDRAGSVVRAAIPADCLAFQVGEALQVHSGGLLRATPHAVRAAAGPAAAGVSRNTFAVFMQPDVDEPMQPPPGVSPQQVAIGQWQPGTTFGQFAEATFEKYYPKSKAMQPQRQ